MSVFLTSQVEKYNSVSGASSGKRYEGTAIRVRREVGMGKANYAYSRNDFGDNFAGGDGEENCHAHQPVAWTESISEL
jgi:hypothetical protein